jgi:hypothetical protein
MKILIAVILITFSNLAYAIPFKVHLKCFSGSYVIFDADVSEVYPGDGYIVAAEKGMQTVIIGDCIIRYADKKSHVLKSK